MPAWSSGELHAGHVNRCSRLLPGTFNQPLWTADGNDHLCSLLSVPLPRKGKRERPKNASTSTTGSTAVLESSDCEPSLVRSNPNPLSLTLAAVPANESMSRTADGSTEW